MRKIILFAALTALCGCREKTERKDIIVPAPARETVRGPQQMTQTRQQRDVEWLGAKYRVVITRAVDRSLPHSTDESGQDYYDNSIAVRVTRPDGTTFFERAFTKAAFASYITDTETRRRGALLGIVFDRVDNARLSFAVSVGSPDMRSDEFVPLTMTLDRMGGVSIAPDTRLDADGEEDEM